MLAAIHGRAVRAAGARVLTPLVIYALPRSRTAWLARFLTYGDHQCSHDQARYVRSPEDVRAWLAQDCTGSVETAAAPFWRLVQQYRPDLKTAVIRRPVDEVVDSLMRLDMRGVCGWDRDALTRLLRRLDAKLDQIEARVPGVLSVRFADLAEEETCARLFEHCLPYPHDPAWWRTLASVNVQASMPHLMRYMQANKAATHQAAALCRRRMRSDLVGCDVRLGELDAAGISVQEEPYETVWRDSASLMAEHCASVGEPPDNYLNKNIPLWERLGEAGAWLIVTARCNGRILGYLWMIVAPSLNDRNRLDATQYPLFVSADAAGVNLGVRLQRAAIERCRARGVSRVFMRAGIRGQGPRLGVIYKRVGAQDDGQLYRLDLEAA